jgi:cobalt-zinc-cadmium efflux system outer membrane protein
MTRRLPSIAIPSCRFRITAAALVLVAIVAVRPARGQTPATATLSLQGAIERALGANRTLAAARLQRAIDVAGVGVASERPNPEVLYEASKETPRQAIGGTIPIELGGKRQRRIELAHATVAASEADLARIIAEVRNDVRRAYFEVVAADLRVTIADDIRTLATRARDAAKARVDAGDVPQSDLTQSALALANSENEMTAARGEAAAARAELNALLGQAADTPLALADDLTVGSLLSLQEALTQASQTNAAILLLDRRIAEQTARLNLAKALQTPDAAAGSTFTYDAEPEFRYGWRLSVGVTLPIFTTHRAGVLVEEATLTRLRAEREATLAIASGAIAAALARAASAREQMTRYQNDILPLALESERQAQAAYNGGQIGLPALVQALQTARDTRQRGLQASLDYQRALADLERAIGAGAK